MIPRLCLHVLGAGMVLTAPWTMAQTAEHIEQLLEESSEQHRREELGVNPITAPQIRDLLTELEQFRPVPMEVVLQNRRDLTFSNRLQTAMHVGSLVADGFMLTLAERQAEVEAIGRALLRQAGQLGVGERLTRRSKSILEHCARGDWIGLRQELIDTQTDVENAMMELRDEEIAHLVSFGGWVRGFQLACHATTKNYFPQRAQNLLKLEVVEYFRDRLSTLHPRLQNTQLVTGINRHLERIDELMRAIGGRPPTLAEVQQMRAEADAIFFLSVSPVNEEGRVTGPPQILRQP